MSAFTLGMKANSIICPVLNCAWYTLHDEIKQDLHYVMLKFEICTVCSIVFAKT